MVEPGADGAVSVTEMKRWCRQNPDRRPPNTDPDRGNSQKLARAFGYAGWSVELTATEVRISPSKEAAVQAAAVLDAESEPLEDEGESSEETAFALERQLQDFMVSNLRAIPVNGKRLRLHVDETSDGVEYPTSSNRRIDILARDEDDNFIVFELKRGQAPDSAIGQLLNYMGWVKLNLAKDKQVTGVIVARDISERMREAIVMTTNITLFEYQLRFELSAISQATATA